MFASPGEIFISIGPLKIFYYGLFMALAMFVGVFVSNLIRAKFYTEISEEDFFNLSFVVIIFGIIGARLYYCLLSLPYYLENPIEIFFIRQGGMAIHGALIGGLLSGLLFLRFKRMPVLKICDLFAYGLVLAQAIGRWGNFFNSEAFGKPTEIFCKLFIPISHRPLQYIGYEYFHPTFLYESLLDALVFLILFFVIRKLVKEYSGLVFASYLILYSIARIIVEHLRIDSVFLIAGIPFPIIMSVIIIVSGLIMVAIILKNKKH